MLWLKNKKKLQEVFLFDSNIQGALINKLCEVKPGHYDAVIIVCRIKSDDEINDVESLTGDYEIDNLRFRIYSVKFIEIDGLWFIDDIYLDNSCLK